MIPPKVKSFLAVSYRYKIPCLSSSLIDQLPPFSSTGEMVNTVDPVAVTEDPE